MRKKQIGNATVIILALLYPLLWLQLIPASDDVEILFDLGAEILAGTAMILMSMGIFLSTRPRWLEDYFGGLDKMYVTHRRLATTVFILLIVHFLINVDLPPDQPGTIMGTLAFLGITISVLLALSPRYRFLRSISHLAYHQWHFIHRFVGIFFIMGLIHYIWVVPKSLGTIPGTYMLLFSIAGAIAYLYQQVLARFIAPKKIYIVSKLGRLNESTSEIILQPKDEKLQYSAGQFQFVKFPGDHNLKEQHPFTISSSPQEESLRLTIKASGDWTRYMQQHLRPEMPAVVTGAYGRFNYKTGQNQQVWIAGGIGVTPFLSWVRDMNTPLKYEIFFFYSCRKEDDAVFWAEFQQATADHSSFHSHLQISSRDGRLTPAQIAEISSGSIVEKDIYLCGPPVVVTSFSQQFQEMGVHRRNIHYEEFRFR